LNLFYQPRLGEGITSLEGDEAHHAIRVLRLKVGDQIRVTDGKGALVEAALEDNSGKFTVKRKHTPPSRSYSIHLFVAPTKNADRMEWLVEKATEIGVSSITMVKCEHSERKHINHDRLLKVAISAMKQSQQSWLPEIADLQALDTILSKSFDQKFIAYVDQNNPDHLKNLATPGHSYAMLIGPEGDFTSNEINSALAAGWLKVSLGQNRLRTETAVLVSVLTLELLNE